MAIVKNSLERNLGGDIIALLVTIGVGFGLFGTLLGGKADTGTTVDAPAWSGGPQVLAEKKQESGQDSHKNSGSSSSGSYAVGNTDATQEKEVVKVALKLKDVGVEEAKTSPLLNYLYRYKQTLAYQATLPAHKRYTTQEFNNEVNKWRSAITAIKDNEPVFIPVYLELDVRDFSLNYREGAKHYAFDSSRKDAYVLCSMEGRCAKDLAECRCLKLDLGTIEFNSKEDDRVWALSQKIKELKDRENVESIQSVVLPLSTRVGSWRSDRIENQAEPTIRLSSLRSAELTDAVAVYYKIIGETDLVREDFALPISSTTAAVTPEQPFDAAAPALPTAAHVKSLAPVGSLSFEPMSTWKDDVEMMRMNKLDLDNGACGQSMDINGEQFNTPISLPDDEGTIMFWFKPQEELVSANDDKLRVLLDLGYSKENRFRMAFRKKDCFYVGLQKEGIPVLTMKSKDKMSWTHKRWYLVTFTYNSDGCTLYINDKKEAEAKMNFNLEFMRHNRVQFGAYNGYFKGNIDDFAVWERVLPLDEIKKLAGGVIRDRKSYCPQKNFDE